MKLLSLYLFALLAATAKSLNCYQSGTSQVCTSGKCFSQEEENNIVGGKSGEKYSLQSCLSSCKELNIKFTFGEKEYFRAATKCCDTDNCNSIPAVPSADAKNSNLECPACFALSSTYCQATVIKCPESENQCVNITGMFFDASGIKSFYGRGCTTPAAKNVTIGDSIVTNKDSWLEIAGISMEKATGSSWSVQGSFTVTLLLSGLIGIQLTNFFY
ncbi:phospholipase A2 inhibitor and Ly6/PLAUR domain-containing protein-like isoform 1-T2 [Liasis olivaceus]